MSCATMQQSQRRSKLKASEAALLAGELTKPSWQSRNEGIHERVSFEDSIWGFDLAGGSFYKTPLRVTAVKKDSRAEKAGIRPGDQLLRINDIDTSTLTIQEAHTIIVDSGVHIRLAVSAPEDTEDSYHCWQDEINNPYDSDEERREEEEKAKKRIIRCRTNANWSLQWPWVSKRRIIYKESNCFMVPSKYESKHRDKFPDQPSALKAPEDIVLHSKTSNTPTTEGPKQLEFSKTDPISPILNGNHENNNILHDKVKLEDENKLNLGQKHDRDRIPTQNGASEENELDEIPMDIQQEILENSRVDTETIAGTNQSIADENDSELENWNPNDIINTIEDDASAIDDIIDDIIKEQDEIQEAEQDQLLTQVLNGHEASGLGIDEEQNYEDDG